MPDNKDSPFGMKPIKHLNGSPWNGKFNIYYKAVALNEAMFIGTPIQLAGSADTFGKYPTVKLAGTSPILGVIIGFPNTPYIAADVTDLDKLYSLASTASYVAVVDDPSVIFEMQEDDADGDTLDADDVGLNASATTESGSTTTGQSTVEIDRSTVATTSTFNLKLLRLVDRPGNAMGAYSKWEVLINNHGLGQGLGSTGVST